MNIIVCLHGAVSGAARLGRNDSRAIALACALPGEHKVTAMLAGAPDEAQPLQAALAAGIDRATRITGERFAAADFHTLGQVLASAARSLDADLVLAGARADTEGLGALSASVARHMGLPHLANIETLDLLPDRPPAPGWGASLAVTVRGGGQRRRLAVSLPIVMSVACGSSGPHPTPRPRENPGKIIETLSLVDPEATVLRRRTEILGASQTTLRATRTVSSAAELLAELMKP